MLQGNAGRPVGPNRWVLILIAAAAVIGTIALYVTNPSGGSCMVKVEPINKGAAPALPVAGSESGLAAFVRKAKPEPLPPIRFMHGSEQPVGLDAFRGKVVLMNLWATWCAPCRKEMPALDRLQGMLGGKDFEVVAVSLDRAGAGPSKKFLDEIGVKNLKLYIEPSARLGAELKAIGLPATLLIDREGREIGRLVGPAEWDHADAQALVKAAIGGR